MRFADLDSLRSLTVLQDRARRRLQICASLVARQGQAVAQAAFLQSEWGASPSIANRADSTANTAARSDKHGAWIKNRRASKASGLLLANSLAAVNHAGVTARGLGWLPLCREIPKAPNSSENDDNSTQQIRVGLLCATD